MSAQPVAGAIHDNAVVAAPRSRRLRDLAVRWHRKLAIVGGVALLIWGGSGLLHPLMTTFGPQQAQFFGPRLAWDMSGAMTLPALLASNGVQQATAVQVVAGPDGQLLQVTDDPLLPRRYFDLASGAELPDQGRRQAVFFARHYLGDAVATKAVSAITVLTDFTPDYPWVNRLLPVYRVDFDTPDNLSAYIYTETNAVAGVTNNFKSRVQTGFRTLHSWDWLPEQPVWLKLLIVTPLVGSLFATSLAGFGMLLTIRRRNRAPGVRG